MKAVVMAGGEGTRLRPLTLHLPKPLLPVADQPIMEHVLRLLKRHGLTDTVVTVQYLSALVRDRFGDGGQLGMSLSYAEEEHPLGTAGSVKNAEEQLAGEPFVVISGDALTDIDLTALIGFHRQRGALVTVCLSRVPDPREFGITILGADGRVERFLEKPAWGQVFSDTVNTGIYVMEPEVLDYVDADVPVDWSGDVFPRLLAEGRPVYGYVAEGYWEDVGTHAAYVQAQADVLTGRVAAELDAVEAAPGVWIAKTAQVDMDAVLEGPLYVGEHARIEAGARVGGHTVVGAHTVVDRGAWLERAVVHPHAYVGPGAQVRGGVVGANSTLEPCARVGEGAVLGAGCLLREESSVADGALVYPGKTVEARAHVDQCLIWAPRATASLFGPRGVSGRVATELPLDLVVRLTSAYAGILPCGADVAVARDHSPGAQLIAPVVISALRAAGVDVRDLGQVPVPLARGRAAAGDGGVVVTTTPGVPDSVDIALLDGQGLDLPQSVQRKIDRAVALREFRRAPADRPGRLETVPAAWEAYADRLLAATDSGAEPGRRLKVVVDAAGGSTALVLPAVLGRLGVEALTVNGGLDPQRRTETADERAAALHRLGFLVSRARAAFGVRFDATGERLSLVDERGRVVDGDRALLLMLHLVTAEAGGGRVALPTTGSRAAEQVASRHTARVLWTATAPDALARAVGEAGVVFAGDGEGSFILPRLSPYPDAVAAFVELSRLLARTAGTLSELVARLPRTFVRRRELPADWQDKGRIMRAVAEAVGDRAVDTVDGIRVVESDSRWVLVLPDSSAPSVHLWAEGPDPASVDRLLDEWSAVVGRPAVA
ncbi:sugar phosphate nucleotidyltransferase [Streptomyces sp. NPDC052309]|uniref:sugar phosphate nucleotidyltransferase n=1 Tax=Streptomyces sp. NPDC052309 TaxID=3155421 RepID=UPI003444883D